LWISDEELFFCFVFVVIRETLEIGYNRQTDTNFSNKFQLIFVYTQTATGRWDVTNFRNYGNIKNFWTHITLELFGIRQRVIPGLSSPFNQLKVGLH